MKGKGGAGMPADPALPRWVCQNCRHALCVVGVDSYADKVFNDPARSGMMQGSIVQGSVMGASRMDNSFVVLSTKQSRLMGANMPPRPTRLQPDPLRPMEDSFVVLPPPDASTYHLSLNNNNSSSNNNSTNNDNNNNNNDNNNNLNQGSSSGSCNNAGFHSSVMVLKRAFEIATTQTQIEQPLCLECMRVLSDKLEKEVGDLNRDIQAYESCLQNLDSESNSLLTESEFLKEKQKIEEEERKLEAAIEEVEKQNLQVDSQMKELEIKSKLFDELEERYWHDFNNFQFQLTSHQEERDAILAKIEVSQAHLELLKRTNVLNDAFYISHEGEFGTINNFRLGRLPKQQVEWDEVNAAWGQACLLLHTMAQYFRPKFPYKIKIIPMGSYPRMSDTNGSTYELFGPVNIFWSTRYDKAMTLFLTCLKEFAEFANFKDQENNIPPEKCFKLPYKIENDKVENYTITQSFNKLENWTKALKYMLCNLKWVLFWFVGNTNFQPLSAISSSHSELMKN